MHITLSIQLAAHLHAPPCYFGLEMSASTLCSGVNVPVAPHVASSRNIMGGGP